MVRSIRTKSAQPSRRPRGLSFSSIHSQAVSEDGSIASDTDESLRDAEEDVWFPVQNAGDIYELDVLTLRHREDAHSTQIPETPEETASINSEHSLKDVSYRFSFFAAGLESTIHSPELVSLVGDSGSFSNLFKPENGTFYLDCYCPTETEMRAISRAFGIHPLTTEDIQTEEAREKFEMFKNYYMVVYHTFKEEPINFYILVFKEGVISFHFEPVTHCRTVRRRMRQLRDYISFSPDWIAYALVDDITDSIAPEIKSLEKEADFIEDAVYLDWEGKTDMPVLLQRIGEGRKHAMHLIRILSGKPDVVRSFIKRVGERNMNGEMPLYLGDVLDHLVTMSQNLSTYEKIFGRSHFNYMGLLQMEFVNATNTMTSVLGKVTLIGTILLPMNLITGLWGMNVQVPGKLVGNLRWFFVILGCMLFVIITLLSSGCLFLHHVSKHNHSRATN